MTTTAASQKNTPRSLFLLRSLSCRQGYGLYDIVVEDMKVAGAVERGRHTRKQGDIHKFRTSI